MSLFQYLRQNLFTRSSPLPNMLSLLRLLVAPFFYVQLINGSPYAYPIFLIAVTSDLLDGRIARHYNVSSVNGAALDASADLLLIASGITFFVTQGLISPTLLIVMAFSFIQYITTINMNLDDFLGKYVGTVLYLSLGVIMIFPIPFVGLIVSVIGTTYILVAFVSRLHKIRVSKSNLRDPYIVNEIYI